MSVVVSDSGPVHYLVLCEAIEVIPVLYGKLVIPATVARELGHAQTPTAVREWVQKLPHWASTQHAAQVDPAVQLGLGEREAIALASELKATQLLVDDRAARRVAVQRGLLITGTVGVLEHAAARGLLNLSDVLQKLLATNFRVDVEVVRQALASNAARQGERGNPET